MIKPQLTECEKKGSHHFEYIQEYDQETYTHCRFICKECGHWENPYDLDRNITYMGNMDIQRMMRTLGKSLVEESIAEKTIPLKKWRRRMASKAKLKLNKRLYRRR